MSLAASLRSVPKPILFGAFDGAGGFLAAVLLGELLWLIFRPSPPPPSAPVARCPECGTAVTGAAGMRLCKRCGALS